MLCYEMIGGNAEVCTLVTTCNMMSVWPHNASVPSYMFRPNSSSGGVQDSASSSVISGAYQPRPGAASNIPASGGYSQHFRGMMPQTQGTRKSLLWATHKLTIYFEIAV